MYKLENQINETDAKFKVVQEASYKKAEAKEKIEELTKGEQTAEAKAEIEKLNANMAALAAKVENAEASLKNVEKAAEEAATNIKAKEDKIDGEKKAAASNNAAADKDILKEDCEARKKAAKAAGKPEPVCYELLEDQIAELKVAYEGSLKTYKECKAVTPNTSDKNLCATKYDTMFKGRSEIAKNVKLS